MKKFYFSLFSIFILVILYYFTSVLSSKSWVSNFCANKHCLELLSLGDFLSIAVSIIGLVFVVQSLDGWKHQDRFFNAREICNLLIELKNLTEFELLLIIDKIEYETPPSININQQRESFKKVFFELKLFKVSRTIEHKILYSNCLYKDELKEVHKRINKKIHEMYTYTENENLKNLQSFLHIIIRDDFKNISKTLQSINEKLNKKAE